MEGREREGPQVTVEPGPLRALLRHCLCPSVCFLVCLLATSRETTDCMDLRKKLLEKYLRTRKSPLHFSILPLWEMENSHTLLITIYVGI